MGDRLVCADCGTEAVHGACPDETCRRGRRPDPLAVAFTEALTAPAGPIPAGFAEDYAAELANLARSVLARERPKPHARILRNSPTEVDEVVFHDATVHIEQMDEQCWTVIIDQAGGQWIGNMVCADGRLTFVEQENDGIDWDEDRTHESVVTSGDMAVELPGIEPDKVVDLMEALERSIAEAKAARKRHPQPEIPDA